MEKSGPDKRMHLRGPIIVTHVKMGDERRYFFGYAKNISRSGVYIHTMAPKEVGEEFDIEFDIPKTGISIKCRCKVVWNRRYSGKSGFDPGMGLQFEGLDPKVSDAIEEWVRAALEKEGGKT